MKARCLECDGEIQVPDDVMVGEIVSCPDCGSDFEVASIRDSGVELKAAETTAEDWGE